MKRVGHKTVKINDKVYILGGYTGGKIGLGELISTVEIFDPKRNNNHA
ncbi:Kelch repeat-containing protein [Paenibacillus sp. MER TA 81-3]